MARKVNMDFLLGKHPISYWLDWIDQQYEKENSRVPVYVVEAFDEAIALLRQQQMPRKEQPESTNVTQLRPDSELGEARPDTFGFRKGREGEVQVVDVVIHDLQVVVDVNDEGQPIYGVKLVGDRGDPPKGDPEKLRDYMGTFTERPSWLGQYGVGDQVDISYVRKGDHRTLQKVGPQGTRATV